MGEFDPRKYRNSDRIERIKMLTSAVQANEDQSVRDNYRVSELRGRSPLRLGQKLFSVRVQTDNNGLFATAESAWSERGAIRAARERHIKTYGTPINGWFPGLIDETRSELRNIISDEIGRRSVLPRETLGSRLMVGVAEKLTGLRRPRS